MNYIVLFAVGFIILAIEHPPVGFYALGALAGFVVLWRVGSRLLQSGEDSNGRENFWGAYLILAYPCVAAGIPFFSVLPEKLPEPINVLSWLLGAALLVIGVGLAVAALVSKARGEDRLVQRMEAEDQRERQRRWAEDRRKREEEQSQKAQKAVRKALEEHRDLKAAATEMQKRLAEEGRVQRSQLNPRKIEPFRLAPEGAEPFQNMIRALYAGDVLGYREWRDRLCATQCDDAHVYVACLLDAVWATGVLSHCSSFEKVTEKGLKVPDTWYEWLDRATRAYEVLPAIPELPIVVAEGELSNALCAFEHSHSPAECAAAAEQVDQCGIANLYRSIGGRLRVLSGDTFEYVIQKIPPLPQEKALGKELSRERWGRACETLKQADAYQDLWDREWEDVTTNIASLVLTPSGDLRVVRSGGARLRPAEKKVAKAIDKSLMGMVGLSGLRDNLAIDLAEFLTQRQSRGRIIWGPSGVGKTELAQRLAGLRDGLPGLSLEAGAVQYVSGVDGKLDVKDLVDNLEATSVLLIDEADKCLDPKAGMVTAAEAKQTALAIVTHFQRKPIFWILLGTWSASRGEGPLTDELVQAALGDELGTRFDYADWGIPAWTLETLLKAVTASRRKITYDDDAALLLAEYCLSKGGVRAFDNLEAAFARSFRTSDRKGPQKVDVALARSLLSKRGG